MPGDLVDAHGQPVCDEFACVTWGCWCPRAPVPECEHGNPVETCETCIHEDGILVEIAALRRANGADMTGKPPLCD